MTDLRRHRTRDWLWASIPALALTVAAVSMVGLGVFRYSRFEDAVLPGGIIGIFAAYLFTSSATPHAEFVVFWTVSVAFTFALYFCIFYAGIKLVRFVVNAMRS